MPTPQFSSTLTDALKNPTAWRFNLQLGTVFSPRFFCCTDPNELGIVDGKEPVAIILASAYSVGEGGSISFDGTNSYDPDGSIVAYSWSFSGGTPSSSTSSTQSVTFNSPGKKRIRLTVTDGTGKRSVPAEVEIQVIPAGDGLGTDDTGAFSGILYASQETGLQVSLDAGENWNDVSNGLSGDSAKIRDFVQDPRSYNRPQINHIIFAATDGGIYLTINGGQEWNLINPDNVPNLWSDAPAPTVDDLLFTNLQFYGNRLYVTAYWQNGSSEDRAWIFYANITNLSSITWVELTTGTS